MRVVERLENTGRGLNLTLEVIDGILHHTKGEQAATPEGRIVRIADRIAYVNHDMDDAIRAGVLREEDIPLEIHMALGDCTGARIDTLVRAMVRGGEQIRMDPAVQPYFDDLHEFMYEHLYYNPKRAKAMLCSLYRYFIEHPDELPEEYALVRERDGTHRAVADYVAGMTDNYALELYHELYIPRGWAMTLRG